MYTAYKVDDAAILTKMLGAWQYLPAERSKVPWRQVVGFRGDRQNYPGLPESSSQARLDWALLDCPLRKGTGI